MDARALEKHREARVEQRRVSAKFVDDEPTHQRTLFGLQQRNRAVESGEHAAAVDVPDEKHGGVRIARNAHIDDVVLREVDLGGAAGAFDHHDVVRGTKSIERARDDGPKLRFEIEVVARVLHVPRMTEHDDLRRLVALRLQENRVHVDGDGYARGHRLHRLRAANLSTVERHRGVVRHVLRLEWRHAIARICKKPTERRYERRLPGVR